MFPCCAQWSRSPKSLLSQSPNCETKPVPPAGAAPEKHLEVGSHFMSPLPVGRDWSLQRRSIGSRSTSEKNFHKFELAALEEQDGSTGYDRTAVLFHHTDCGCGIFCYSPYDEARAACTTNSVIRQPFRKVIELSAVAGPIDSAVRSRDSARDTSTPIHTIHSSHVHQHHTPRTSTDFRPTHNRAEATTDRAWLLLPPRHAAR